MKKVYFASPFFNEEQVEREERLKAKLRSLGFFVWSPKESCFLKSDATIEDRIKVFKENCTNLADSDIIFVVTDGKDVGTIWEAGFACGLNQSRVNKIKVVYYCETLGNRPFNLMLAQSGNVVITDFNDLDNLNLYLLSGKGKDYVGSIE